MKPEKYKVINNERHGFVEKNKLNTGNYRLRENLDKLGYFESPDRSIWIYKIFS